jgi:hypothetical protein
VLVQLSKYNYLEEGKSHYITNPPPSLVISRSPESNLLILATLNVELAPTSVKSVRTLYGNERKEQKVGECESEHDTKINFREFRCVKELTTIFRT